MLGDILDKITRSQLKSTAKIGIENHFNNMRMVDGVPVNKQGQPQHLHYSRLPNSPQDPSKHPKGRCAPIPVNTPDEYCRLFLGNEMKEKQFSLAEPDLSSLLNLITCFHWIQISGEPVFSKDLVQRVKEVRVVRNDWAHEPDQKWTRDNFLEAINKIFYLAVELGDEEFLNYVRDMWYKKEPTNCKHC